MRINKQRLIKSGLDLLQQLTTRRRQCREKQDRIVCLSSAASALHRLVEGFGSKHPRPSLSTDTTHSWSANPPSRSESRSTKRKFLSPLRQARTRAAETQLLVRHGNSCSVRPVCRRCHQQTPHFLGEISAYQRNDEEIVVMESFINDSLLLRPGEQTNRLETDSGPKRGGTLDRWRLL